MEVIKCPECGKEIEMPAKKCHFCGYPFTKEDFIQCSDNEPQNTLCKDKEVTDNIIREEKITIGEKTNSQKSIMIWLIVIALFCAILSCVFFYKGYDVKNNYRNTDYSILNENAYVGGDAYNYIINGTYFTGYMVIGSSFMICAVIIGTNAVNIYTKINVRKEE